MSPRLDPTQSGNSVGHRASDRPVTAAYATVALLLIGGVLGLLRLL